MSAAHQDRFYALLDQLAAQVGGPRTLAACDGRMGWPGRGVYFFFEAGEALEARPSALRVVHVGTHGVSQGSRSSLWNRLSQHRGTTRGGGSHRGSIFRKLVGEALIDRDALALPSWGRASSPGEAARRLELSRDQLIALEAPLEARVSEHIGAMPFLWLEVDDAPSKESLRGYIVRNAIALLSGAGAATPSAGWLGHASPRAVISESGLWNQRHVGDTCDPRFLDSFEGWISKM